MTTPHHHTPAQSGGATGEIFSPSDRKVIRLDDYRRDRRNLRPKPTLRLAGWMIPAVSNDPNPPSGAPAAARAA